MFQFTHPLRGATQGYFYCDVRFRVSIHAPLAGCDALPQCTPSLGAVSIHAPLAGCDVTVSIHMIGVTSFNSRTPCGVRQDFIKRIKDLECVSIHAPLAGCDGQGGRGLLFISSFNSRTPCGVRLFKRR